MYPPRVNVYIDTPWGLKCIVYLCVRGIPPKSCPPTKSWEEVPRLCITLKTGIMSDLFMVTQSDEDYVDSFFNWD